MQRVSRASRRTYLTHVAFICDHPFYQKYLPQVVIGNEHTLLMRDLPTLQERCPGNFTLVRQKSAWNNGQLMCQIVQKLRIALAPFAAKVQPILLMDVVKLHWTPAVMNKCQSDGIWPMPVPAKLTWLLQPCDTHMFQRYKLHLQKAYQNRQAEEAVGGVLKVEQLLDCIYETSDHIMEDIGGWKPAFQDDGFGAKQAGLSDFRLRHLELEAAPELGALQPSLEQVRLCFPERQRVPPPAKLFCCPALRAPLLAAAKAPALPPACGLPRGVRWPRRVAGLAAAGGGGSSASAGPALSGSREPRTRAEHRRAGVAPGA